MKAKLLVSLLVIAALLTQAALAKGPPQKVTISGGNLSEEIEITGDEATLNALGMMMLEDYRTRSEEAPEVEGLGEGYLITRFYENQSGRLFPFDELYYYPDPDGGRGYTNYIGIVNGSSEYDGEWFRTNSDSEVVLQGVIEAAGEVAEQNGMFDALLQRMAQVMLAAAQ